MKLKDITEHDHPEHCWTWTKTELEFINARVKLAYEEGQKQTVSRAVEEIMELTKRIAELEAAQPEQSEPVSKYVATLDIAIEMANAQGRQIDADGKFLERRAKEGGQPEQSEPLVYANIDELNYLKAGGAVIQVVAPSSEVQTDALFVPLFDHTPPLRELSYLDMLRCLKEVDPHAQNLPLGMELFARAILAAARSKT
ncbi:hypothetical protein UFOVP228_37 [uncultured Caudovirales phage]|uniref:Uncharacterized protein n=1 Tax=uncultured Caudovirales phage TaxID=2100421 RepID=A0A6J5T8C0_9CAUD|nr:hypothetical protein UFOVP47_65 [uncultured Caudovirales phage]CAB5219190.1 hypothetical protein UFOVP228_37 [uncultured Caudovirales phage]